MKTLCRNLVCVGAVFALGTWLARATDPVPSVPPPASPRAGKVLVLTNDRTREGSVERIDGQYRVRHAVGETWVPVDQVACLCQSLEEAYQFLRGRANLQDADERLRLANWCRDNGLRAQALEEIRAAVRLRPGNANSRRLLTYLEQSATPTAGVAAPAGPDLPEPVVAIDLTTEALGAFASRVQPILMNACASCHAGGRGGAFRLTRAYNSTTTNHKTLQRNLAAVLAQVRPRIEVSPLLVKAISAHGSMSQAAIRNRQAPPYRMLEDWVRTTLATNPQLEDFLTAQSGPKPPAPPTAPPIQPPQRLSPAFGEDAVHSLEPTPKTPASPPTTSAADAYSPDEFNRRMHPDRVPPPLPKP